MKKKPLKKIEEKTEKKLRESENPLENAKRAKKKMNKGNCARTENENRTSKVTEGVLKVEMLGKSTGTTDASKHQQLNTGEGIEYLMC